MHAAWLPLLTYAALRCAVAWVQVEAPLAARGILPAAPGWVNSMAINYYHDGSEGIQLHYDDAERFVRPIYRQASSVPQRCSDGGGGWKSTILRPGGGGRRRKGGGGSENESCWLGATRHARAAHAAGQLPGRSK